MTLNSQPALGGRPRGAIRRQAPIVAVSDQGDQIVGYAATFCYADGCCYAGIAEFSAYVRRSHCGQSVGAVAVNALIVEATKAGFWRSISFDVEVRSSQGQLMKLLNPLARAVLVVAILNIAYFGVEFLVALRIESASLLADAVDFLEDAAVNLLILLGLGWTASNRSRLGHVLAILLLAPAVAFAWALWRKFSAPVVPSPELLSVTGLGALAINLLCAFLLARYRHHGGSLAKAAFLSARNDAIANVGIIAAAGATVMTQSIWPDVVVGCAIAWMNIDAAKEVLAAARGEKSINGASA